MKVYPKELYTLNALEKEKKKLKRQLRELDEEELLSVQGLMGKKPKKNQEPEDIDLVSTLLALLPISNPLVGPAIKLAQRLIFKKGDKKYSKKGIIQNYVSAEPYHEEIGHKVKRVAKSVAFEFITGYLKWKAIELTYKGAKHLIQTRKEKKMAAL